MAEDLNPVTEPATDATTTAPVTESAPPADTSTEEPTSFSREYVQELRREAAGYRTKAQPYEETFGVYTDEDRQVWMEAAKLVANDPKAGAEYLENIVKALKASQEAAPASDPADENRPLTVAEFNKLQAEAKAEAAQTAEISRIEKQATDLGYDTESHHYTTLLTVASRLPSGDIAEAHKVLEAEKQAYRDSIIAELQATADGSPRVPSGAATAPSGEKQIKTFKDAAAAAEARISAIRHTR